MIDWLYYLRRLVARKSSTAMARSLTRRPGTGKRRPCLELLEDRLVPTTFTPPAVGPTDWLIRLNGGVVEIRANNVVQGTEPINTGQITINGSDTENDTLTVDYSNGFFKLVSIQFNGGNTSGVDKLTIIGFSTSTTSGIYTPSGTTFGNGSISVSDSAGTTPITFTGLEPVTISRMASFTLTTPNSVDDLTVGAATGPAAEPATVISGTSGGVAIEALTYFDITSFFLDTATNDTVAAGSGNDEITVASNGLNARNWQTFTVNTGNGDDTVTFQGNQLSMPVGGGSFTLNGGGGNDTVEITGDGDYILSDNALQSVNKGLVNISSFEVAHFTGGAGNNQFSLSGWTGSGSVNGLGGTDRVILTGVNNAILADALLTYGVSSVFTLTSIEEGHLTAGNNNSTLDASAFTLGPVTLTGGPGNDLLKGTTKNDSLSGGAGNDVLQGGAGNDTLNGGAGNDSLDGGADNDVLFGEDGVDNVNGGLGNDSLDGGNDGDTLDGGGGNDTLNGGAGNDSFSAVGVGQIRLSNTLFQSAGTSVVLQAMESAAITGSGGADQFDLTGWTGSGAIDGNGGSDALNMYLLANATLTNGLLKVGTDNEIMLTGIGAADLGAAATNSILDASGFTAGAVTLRGGLGNDLLKGGSGQDSIDGGGGNDTISGGAGNDNLSGGSGIDRVVETYDVETIVLTNAQIEADMEKDLLQAIEQAELSGGAGDNEINASAFTLGPVTLSGAGGNDALIGTRFSDSLSGGDGDDTLGGGLGNDILSGGKGNDTINGGAGGDRLIEVIDEASPGSTLTLSNAGLLGDLGTNVLVSIEAADLTGGDGDDVIDASDFNGKVTIVGGDGNDLIRGGRNADSLTGGIGDDSLEGNAGDDTIRGGEGSDNMDGGTGKDTLIEQSESANMILTNTSLNVGMDTLTSIERAILTGGASDNLLDASAFTMGPVTLNGGGGNDVLRGGSRRDRLDGGDGNDALEGNGENDILLGGIGDDSINGNGGNDRIDGGAGNDTVNGGSGSDVISGAAGNDLLSGGGGIDKLVERGDVNFTLTNSSLTGNGTDTVDGFERAVLIGGASDNTISAVGFTRGPVTLRGGSGDDTLRGTNKADKLFGAGGKDNIVGGAGNDLLNGGAGFDTLNGGLGEDTGIAGEILISVED